MPQGILGCPCLVGDHQRLEGTADGKVLPEIGLTVAKDIKKLVGGCFNLTLLWHFVFALFKMTGR